MLKSIILHHFILHKDKQVEFTPGLNTIGGANEKGKSLILEAISFALFGTVALRRKAMHYPKETSVTLTLDIKGVQFQIYRGLGSATLYRGDDVIAKSTTVVNTEIVRLLGYDFRVFKTANMAAQSEIHYLSVLKPEERKKLIENVLGLSATEIVINNHKQKLKELKAAYSSWENSKPEVPPYPPEPLFSEEEVRSVSNDLKNLNETVGNLKYQLNQFTKVDAAYQVSQQKISNLVDTDAPSDFSLVQAQQALHNLSIAKDNLTRFITTKSDCARDLEKFQSQYNPDMPELDAQSLSADWDTYNLSQQKQRFIADGHLTCENCQHPVYLAQETLKQFKHIPDHALKPEYTLSQLETNKRVKAAMEQAELKLTTVELAVKTAEESLENLKSSQPSEQVLSQTVLWHIQKEKNQEIFNEHEVLKKTRENLGDLSSVPKQIASLETQAADLNLKLSLNQTAQQQRQDYEAALARHVAFETELDRISALKKVEDLQIATLVILKESIKSDIIPRINAVASTWVRKLSDGMHNSVTLTDDMDILMNDIEVSAYSGSGKALCHLSLRMALAQVLTKNVLPLFMADEVDASMTPERSTDVLNTLKEMLQSTVKQVLLISHRNLDVALDSNNHIQL